MLKIGYHRLMRMYYESALSNVGIVHSDSSFLILKIQYHRLAEERCFAEARVFA